MRILVADGSAQENGFSNEICYESGIGNGYGTGQGNGRTMRNGGCR